MTTLNENQRRALQYVRNTNGGATLAIFHEDHEPIGPWLWRDIEGLAHVGEDGRVRLTKAGEEALATQSADPAP